MKTKSLFLSLALIFSFAVISSAITPIEPAESLSDKIQSKLAASGIDFVKYDGETVNVRFLINEAGEIQIISTNKKELDENIKAALNYQKVNDNRLTPFERYKINVTFKSA